MHVALKLLLVTTSFVLASPVLAEVLSIAKPETVDVSPDRLSRIRTALQNEVDADRMPGAVVMIARRGQLIYSEAIGFQDKAAGKPMSKDAIFRIYSMTKPLASVAATMLVEEGKMQLTDPVAKFLPQLAKMEVLVTDKDGKTTRERRQASDNDPRSLQTYRRLRLRRVFKYSRTESCVCRSETLSTHGHGGISHDHAGAVRHRHRQSAAGT